MVYNNPMRPISTSESPVLSFSRNVEKHTHYAQSSKIGWMRAQTDKPNASFDLLIKDGRGGIMAQRLNCKTPTTEYGELINLPCMLGETLNIEVSNLKGAEKVDVFLN